MHGHSKCVAKIYFNFFVTFCYGPCMHAVTSGPTDRLCVCARAASAVRFLSSFVLWGKVVWYTGISGMHTTFD